MDASQKELLEYGFDGFQVDVVDLDDVSIAYRRKGEGEAVLLLHGWPLTGREWHKMAPELSSTHDVIVPDYRGAGASSMPDGGYDSETMARDLAALLDELGVEKVHFVGHDIGLMIGAAFGCLFPERLHTLTLIEANIPGLSAYEAFVASGGAWHFAFNAQVEMAVELTHGRQEHYYARFYRDYCANQEAISADERRFVASCYDTRVRLRASYKIYEAFEQNASFFRSHLEDGSIEAPVQVVGGEMSLAAALPMLSADVGAYRSVSISGAGHFIPEEAPEALIDVLRSFWAFP